MTEIKFSKWPRLSRVRQRKINYNKELKVKPLQCELTKNLSSSNNEPYFQGWIIKNKRSRRKRRKKRKKEESLRYEQSKIWVPGKSQTFKSLMLERRKNYSLLSANWQKNKFLKGARFSKLARDQKKRKTGRKTTTLRALQ